MSRWQGLFSGIVLAAAAAVPGFAVGQTEESGLEEIVVTARKVEERIQDIPLAITAFSAADIEAAGIEDLGDIAALTPGLSFFNAVGGFLPTPVIRGVAPTDIFGEVSTAVFLDGVYVSGREGLNFSQLDLDRIEVIKGPTSALYGRNAFSGAINYLTKRPTEELEISGDATAGSEGKVAGKLILSGPLGQGLLGRVAAMYDEWDGSYDNPLPGGDDVGGYRYRSFKGNLLFQPSDSLEVMVSAYYSNDEIDDSATVALQANCENDLDAAPPNERFSNWCGELPDLGTTYRIQNMGLADDEIQRIPRALGENRELLRLSLDVDVDIGFGTVQALTGYFSTDQEAVVDGAFGLGENLPFVYATGCTLFDPLSGLYSCPLQNQDRFFTGFAEIVGGDETEEISQELRFTSRLDRPLRFSVGAYYYHVELDEYPTGLDATRGGLSDIPRLGFFAPVGPTVGLAIGDFIFREWFGPNGDFDPRIEGELDTDSWAGFGWLELDFLERLTARAELRYTDEEKTRAAYLWGDPDLPPDQWLPPVIDTLQDDWQFIAANATLKFQVAEDWQTYVSMGRNVKTGGFDQNSVNYLDTGESDVLINPFDPEKIVAMEVGIKGQNVDGTVRLDVAMFRNDWKDVVVPILYESNPVGSDPNFGREFDQPEGFNDNAGDATVLGWEMGLEIAPTENWYYRFGVSWTDATWDDAKLESFADFPSFAPDGDVSDKTVLRQPPWQLSGSVRYSRQAWGEWDYYNRLDVTWEDEWYVGNENQAVVPDHTNVNLRLGVKSPRYDVELWVNNLLDQDEPTGAFRQPYFTNTAQIFSRSDGVPSLSDPPSSTAQTIFPWGLIVSHPDLRTYGLTVRARFGGAMR